MEFIDQVLTAESRAIAMPQTMEGNIQDLDAEYHAIIQNGEGVVKLTV